MATHDYVIDNSTGANVRADINNVLQAILTNNSSSSAPSTTAAYMWWADTTNGILKIRNSTNNGWVELLQLDGTLTLEDGTKTAPALAHRSNLNTGIFFSAANKFNVSTGGVERLELGTTTIFNEEGADVDFRIEGDSQANLFYVDASTDRIGINDSTPLGKLHIISSSASITSVNADANELVLENNGNCGMTIASSGTTEGTIAFADSGNDNIGRIVYGHNDNSMSFVTTDLERVRVDASGRLLIGITAARTYEQPEPFGGSDTVPALQLEGTGASGGTHRVFAQTYNNNDVYAATHIFAKTRGAATGSVNIVNSGDPLGILSFQGADGVDLEEAAQIRAEVDGTPGSNDMPGRLIFSTTADGAHAPSTRMIIDSSGRVGVGASSLSDKFTIGDGDLKFFHSNAGSFHRTTFIEFGNSSNRITSESNFGSTGSSGYAAGYKFTTKNFNSVSGQFENLTPFVIQANGKVGIGTTSPQKTLDVTGQLAISNSTTSYWNFDRDDSTGAFKIQDTGSTKLTILTTGKVGIGTTSPSTNLELSGHNQVTFGNMPETIISYGATSAYNSASAGAGIQFGGMYNSSNEVTIFAGVHGVKENTTDGNFGGALLFSTRTHGGNSSERLRINSSGKMFSVPTYNNTTSNSANMSVPNSDGQFFRSTSSIKYKDNVTTLTDTLADKILNCRSVSYTSKCTGDDKTIVHYGFIAEEVHEIDTSLVSYDNNTETPEPEGVQYDRFIPALVNLVKRQKTQIETLETKVAALEAA